LVAGYDQGVWHADRLKAQPRLVGSQPGVRVV